MLGFAISSFSSLFILFLPKCFIALFKSDKNTKEYFESSVGIANHHGIAYFLTPFCFLHIQSVFLHDLLFGKHTEFRQPSVGLLTGHFQPCPG
jgi:hypothetical protein